MTRILPPRACSKLRCWEGGELVVAYHGVEGVLIGQSAQVFQLALAYVGLGWSAEALRGRADDAGACAAGQLAELGEGILGRPQAAPAPNVGADEVYALRPGCGGMQLTRH